MHNLTQPPILRGTEKEQLVQMRQYLYQMTRDLNVALTSLTADNFAPNTEVRKAASGELTAKQREQINQGMGGLKSLIIKTADSVRSKINVIETKLASEYVAQSDYGTFKESIETTVRETAADVERVMDSQATLEGEFGQYVINTSSYIKQGIIGYDGATPIIGIAIGQDITTNGKDTIDDVEYDVINVTSNMSIWTPSKLSFYSNGSEEAYVSNGAFFVNNQLYLGNKWAISCENGFSIRWIGG